jgi:hypothetical protein
VQARNRINDGSILWLPSEIWFQFLAGRLDALRRSYEIIYHKEPENHGVLAGLWTYLMQSVMFTPTMVHSYVTNSLAMLRFKQRVDRFGMFFLHDLNLEKRSILKEVMQADDLEVRRTLGISKRKQRIRPRLPPPSPMTSMEVAEFPLGRTPSWVQIKNAIADKPWEMMRPWIWSEELEETVSGDPESMARLAGKLFVLFTVHMWTTGHPSLLKERDPVMATTAREALSAWTVGALDRRTKGCVFLACNAGLPGAIPGTREEIFQDRVDCYFPRTRQTMRGQWQGMAIQPGYLGEYWETVGEGLLEEEQEEVRDWLGRLLAHCQCLPVSTHSDPWKVKRDGGLMVTTNPRYYKLGSVGSAGSRRIQERRQIHMGVKAQQRRILEISGYNPHVAKAAVRLQGRLKKDRRSGKAKNKRQPPLRGGRETQEERSHSMDNAMQEQLEKAVETMRIESEGDTDVVERELRADDTSEETSEEERSEDDEGESEKRENGEEEGWDKY